MKSAASALTIAALAVPAVAQYPTSLPIVDSKSLQESISEDALFAHAQKLQDAAYSTGDRNRNINSYGHNFTVDYIADLLSETGYYKVEKQPFLTGKTIGKASLEVDGTAVTPVNIFDYSPAGVVTAPLIVVANVGCDASDYPANITGNIALIHRGICEMGQKAAIVGGLGGIGVINWNNVEGPLENRTLGAEHRPEGPYPPVVGITEAAGQAFQDRILGGEELTATLNVDANTYNITVNNVLATTLGGDQNNVYQIGGHTDSVGAGPGINDDGSGIISLLELGLQLTKYSVKNAIRFSFWAAEEEGLLGSTYYTSTASNETLSKIRLYNNFDMLASPNFVYAVYDGDGSAFNQTGPPGSDYAEKVFIDWFAEQDLPTIPTEFDGRSDYEGFVLAGIPAGGLFTGAEGIKTAEEAELFGGEAGVAYDINYHGAGDTVINNNATAWLVNSKAIAHTIALYGTTWEGIPPRGASRRRGIERYRARREAAVGKTWGNRGVGKRTAVWLERRI